MAFDLTEDKIGRQVKPILGNESEDGTGTWHIIVCDSSGRLKVSLLNVADDVLFKWGADSDVVALLRAATLSADEELTGVIEGTSVHPATAANTLIISNITDDGDILILASDGGHSKAFVFIDASTPDLYLYNVGGIWTGGATEWKIPAVTFNGAVDANAQSITDVGKLNYGVAASLTIATGVVAVTKTRHKIVVQGGAGGGNDQLDTATGGADGDVLILQPATSGGADTVTVADGTGANAFILAGNANFVMNHIDDRLILLHNGTEWVETSRSANS